MTVVVSRRGMLFRIEDVNGFNPILRTYDSNELETFHVKTTDLDKEIATLVRQEINGAKTRNLYSYSKSLATCLLKYNKYVDNELHIFINNGLTYNSIGYISYDGSYEIKQYEIAERVVDNAVSLFDREGYIQLINFVIDVSSNELVNNYLIRYTSIGKKKIASPQKDNEVVVLNPLNDMSIRNYMGAVYVIYALQLRYHFLNHPIIVNKLLSDIYGLEAFRFCNGEQERIALVNLIIYLSFNWEYEKTISREIYKYSKEQVRTPSYYDSILQFHGILNDSFDETYHLIHVYQHDVITNLALNYCAEYLENYKV